MRLKSSRFECINWNAPNRIRKGSISSKIVASCRHWFGRSAGDSRPQLRRTSTTSFKDLVLEHQTQGGQSTIREATKQAMEEAAFQEMRSIYGVAILALLSVLGITMIALALSSNAFSFELQQWKIAFLQMSTVVFQFSFAVVVFFVWDARRLVALVDATMCIASPFTDWYWYSTTNRQEN